MNGRAKDNIDYIDWLRALACIAVVLQHSSGQLALNFEASSLLASGHFFPVLINKMCYWGVPVFFMVSGALLLPADRGFVASYFLKRRFLKVVVPFCIWSVVYCLFRTLGQPNPLDWHYFVDSVLAIPKGPAFPHLWFFYVYLPLLLLVPVLQSLIKCHGRQLALFYGVVWLFFSLRYTLGDPSELMLKYHWLMYLGYMLVGFVLFDFGQIDTGLLNGKLPFLLFLVGLLLFVLIVDRDMHQHGRPIRHDVSYLFIFVAVQAISIFLICKRYLDFGNRVIRSISRCSFGIYLVHLVFWVIAQKKVSVYFDNHILQIAVVFTLTFFTSWFVTAVLYRIKFTRFLVP